MSYDISLVEPTTKKTITVDFKHQMKGGTYCVGGTDELYLNITWNYCPYFFDATENDERFYKGDKNQGLRAIYGKTGAETIPMLTDMAERIRKKYQNEDETWKKTKRKETLFLDENGCEIEVYFAIRDHKKYSTKEVEVTIDEGDDTDYWKATAVNAMKPIYQLIVMAQMRPDGIWDGD